MTQYPVTDPSRLERVLFDAGLLRQAPLEEIYDIKAGSSIQAIWDMNKHSVPMPDIHAADDWDNGNPHIWMRWEFFSYLLRDCARVLDVGCGDGWPATYVARSVAEVVGIDISPGQIELARKRAQLTGLTNIHLDAADMRNLPYPDGSFDGACFGGNALTYGSDQPRILGEICRVLKPGGVFVFEQRPGDPTRSAGIRVSWFIDGGPPLAHYVASSGCLSREILVFVTPESQYGRRLADAATRMSGELSGEQRLACDAIRLDIENGLLDFVDGAIYGGEDRTPSAQEFPRMLADAGFEDFRSWALPNAAEFARELEDQGILHRLRQDDFVPFVRALIRSAPQCERWAYEQCTCRKP